MTKIKIPKEFDKTICWTLDGMFQAQCHDQIRHDYPFLSASLLMDDLNERDIRDVTKEQLEIWNNDD